MDPQFAIIPKDKYKRLTWKNGLGFTDEIAIYPEGSDLRKGDFLWRLSSARIEQASPFSIFPLHDRVLVILKGAGIRLFHRFEESEEEEKVELPPLNGEVFPWEPSGRWNFVFSAQGSVEINSLMNPGAHRLEEGDTLSVNLDEPLPADQPIELRSSLGLAKLVTLSFTA